MRKEKF